MGKLFLTLVLLLQAATVAGAVDDASYKNSPVGKRSLSQSLLDSFFMMPRPRVDRCRGEMKIDDETGEKIPAVICDFIVPKNYNSTAGIQLGSCHDIDEPVCGEKLDDIYCDGPFVLSGNIRTVTYPEIHQYELNSAEFNHTYCARADVYNDVDGSGKQMHIASAKREVIITFIGGNVDEYMVDMGEEEGRSESSSPMAALIGSSTDLNPSKQPSVSLAPANANSLSPTPVNTQIPVPESSAMYQSIHGSSSFLIFFLGYWAL